MLKLISFASAVSKRQLVLPLINGSSTVTRHINSFYDPPYLDSLKPPIPVYDELTVQIRGYDFAVLENFQSLIHKIAVVMDVNVDECWAIPATNKKIQRFKLNSTVIDSEYNLKLYERNVGLVEVPSTTCSIFIQAVQAALPQGVTLNVHRRTPEDMDIRYIPDLELKQLKDQLETATIKKK